MDIMYVIDGFKAKPTLDLVLDLEVYHLNYQYQSISDFLLFRIRLVEWQH